MMQNGKQKPFSKSKNEVKTEGTQVKTATPFYYYITLFCIPVILYFQTIGFDLVRFDDTSLLENNKTFLQDGKNVLKAFQTDAFIVKVSPFYRPLQTVSFIIDKHFSMGSSYLVFHLSNILLLGFIACLLYVLLKRFSVPKQLSLLASILFVVHPLWVYTVAWIPARGDLLLTIFSLSSFLFLIKYLQNGKLLNLILHVLTFMFALFSKETAAVLPILFMLYYFWFSEKKLNSIKKTIIIASYFGLGVLWFWIRNLAINGYEKTNSEVGFKAFLSNVSSLFESIYHFIQPITIAPIPSFSLFETGMGILIIILLLFFVFKKKEKSNLKLLFGLFWFFIEMLPTLIFKHPYIDYLHHRFLLPSVGILLILVLLVPKQWFNNGKLKHSWILLLLITIFGIITFLKSQIYVNPLAFYNAVIMQNNSSGFAYNNRGIIYLEQENFPLALDDFNEAIKCDSTDYEAFYNRGKVKASMNDNLGAIVDYSKAIALHPTFYNAYYNRGNANSKVGDTITALDDYAKTISLCPTFAEAFNNQGTILLHRKQYTDAISIFKRAITLKPKFAEAYNNCGNAKLYSADYNGAISDFTQATTINPNYANAYFNKGLAYQLSSDFKNAIASFSQAISVNQNFEMAYMYRAINKFQSSDFNGAIIDCDFVLKLNPNNQRAQMCKQQSLITLQSKIK